MTTSDSPEVTTNSKLTVALVTTVTIAGFVVLTVLGYPTDAAILLGTVVGPGAVGSYIVSKMDSQHQKTREGIGNGLFAKGLVNALDHPQVVAKIESVVSSHVESIASNIAMAFADTMTPMTPQSISVAVAPTGPTTQGPQP